MRLHRACLTSLFALLAATAFANTEKVIFVAPPSGKILASLSLVENLVGHTFTPSNTSLRTSLPVRFPSDNHLYGDEYWYLLRHLNPGQRYEVRICWAASQPTDFVLEVLDIEQLVQELELISSARRSDFENTQPGSASSTADQAESAISLRIRATADFYSTNHTLMQHPPPVDVDIILDRYLANIFPASLVLTAVYILVLAVVGWYISGLVWSILQETVPRGKRHAD